jgi:acetate kinase
MVSEESNAILVINCGSSSVKFSLIKPESGESFLSGLAQRLNTEEASIKIKYTMENKEEAFNQSLKFPYDHIKSLEALVEKLKELSLDKGITAIGHRIVHGGDLYSEPTLINDKVKKAIQSLAKLAPLHNPANLTGIDACQAAFEGLPQVAVFDTAFHQTMPSKAFLYGIPKKPL